MRCLFCGSEDFEFDNCGHYRCSKCWCFVPEDKEENSAWDYCAGCGLHSDFLDEGYCAGCILAEPYDRDPHDPRNDQFLNDY